MCQRWLNTQQWKTSALHSRGLLRHWRTGDGGLAAVMQLLHLFLEEPAWEAAAMERAKQLYVSHYRALPKSLERASADRIMAAMLGPDRCLTIG